MFDLRLEHGQVLVFGGFSGRVRRGAAALAAEQHVRTQLAGLVQENAELRRMYKHMETQLTFAAEELSGAQARYTTHPRAWSVLQWTCDY